MFENQFPQQTQFQMNIHSSSHHYLAFSLIVISVICFVPFLTKIAGKTLRTPGTLISKAWNFLINLIVPKGILKKIDGITPESLDRYLSQKTANSSDALLRGDVETKAREMFPEARFPWLYQDVPGDLRRPLTWDGRLPNGHPVSWLAWRHLDSSVVADFARNSVKQGIRMGAGLAIILTSLNLVRILATGLHAPFSYPTWATARHLILPQMGWYVDAVITTVLSAGWVLAIGLVGSIILTPAFGFFTFWNAVRAHFAKASSALATPTRDSLVVYKHRADIRETEQRAYAEQVNLALANPNVPVIPVGEATGMAFARGSSRSLLKGSVMSVDGYSIRQHVLAFGGTGEGKTELFLKPMTRRVLSANWQEGMTMGAYITDGKGVLYKDIITIPEIQSRASEIKVLGTEPGHYGVNIVEGMTPLQTSTMFTTVNRQVFGEGADKFWTEQASIAFYHGAVIGDALERSPLFTGEFNDEQWTDLTSGITDEDILSKIMSVVQAWEHIRPKSFMGYGKLATDVSLIEGAVALLAVFADSQHTSEEFKEFLATGEIVQTTTWVLNQWLTMANETRSSIIANVNSVLGKFSGAPEIMHRFCTGMLPEEETTDVDFALNGGILCCAVGESEWGAVGQVIAVWLKTRLYIQARKRQVSDPESAKKKSCLFLCDEFQMLATSGGSESDAEFFNIARSTGVFMVGATQALSSLQKRLGKEPTTDLLNNLRTKVLLRLEDTETLEMFQKLAGETFRGVVVDDDFYETQGQREIERPDVSVPVRLSERASFRNVFPTFWTLNPNAPRGASKFDPRFILKATANFMGGGGISPDSANSSRQSAFWRQEDKEREIRGQGVENRPVFSSMDLKQGSGFAFAYVQRAGGHFFDIVKLSA